MAPALVSPPIEAYASASSTPASPALRWIEKNTRKKTRLPEMMVGHLEGAFLASLVRFGGVKRVLEIGSFTGYSALAMAESLPPSGRVLTLELDPEHGRLSREGWKRSRHGKKIRQVMGHALSTLPLQKGPFDFCFIDADKQNYQAYFDLCLPLLRKGGLIAVDNTLWSGEVLKPRSPEALALARFNRSLKKDRRVDPVLLPLRDGISLAFKR